MGTQRKMKDGRGVERRQCCVEGCNCPEYKVLKDGRQTCITCHHPPVRHVAVHNNDIMPNGRSVPTVFTSKTFGEESESSSEDDDEVEEWEEESEEDNETEEEDSGDDEEFEEMQGDEYYVGDYGYGSKKVRYGGEDLVRDGMVVDYNLGSLSPNFVGAQRREHTTVASLPVQPMTSLRLGSSSLTTRLSQKPHDMKLCKLPGCGRPVHQGFEFCRRSHGVQFSQMSLNTGNPLVNTSNSPQPVSASPMSPREKCKIPSCTKKRFLTDGVLEDFCGKTCANAARHQGIQLQSLWLLPPGSQEYTAVSNQFFTSWKKGTAPSRNCIRGIFCIDVSRLQKNYTSYVKTQLKGSPNEVTYFHGTTLRCNIVSTSNFCGSSTCGACGISQRGFLQCKVGTHVRFQRLGKAFYFSPNSSKCHEYSEGHSGCRALILCRIAQGKVYQATQDMPNLSSPPPGYDSVSAFPPHHRGMNYGEVATYSEHATLPTHIIVYQHQGERLLL